MVKKMMKMFLLGTMSLLVSCVDETYDFANKEFVNDVKIEGNKLALPLGNLRAIMLDSLFSVEDIAVLDKADGVYRICAGDTVISFSKEIDPIEIAVKSSSKKKDIKFNGLPNIPNLPIGNRNRSFDTSPSMAADFSIDLPLNINQSLPYDIEMVKSVDFISDVPINITLDFGGLKDLGLDVHLDAGLVLPSILDWYSEDESVIIRNDSLILDIEKSAIQKGTIQVTILCRGLNLSDINFEEVVVPESGEATEGLRDLHYSTHLMIGGLLAIKNVADINTDVLLGLVSNGITLEASLEVGKIGIKNFCGIYRGEIDRISKDFEIGKDFQFLKNNKNSLVLSNPQMMIGLENSIGVPVDFDFELVGKDKYGDVIESSIISLKGVRVESAYYDSVNNTVAPRMTKLLFVRDTTIVAKDGYVKVQVPNLGRLFEVIPHSIEFSCLPKIDTNVYHYIDISRPITIMGEYAMEIPMDFENMHISYSDTIKGINLNLQENSELFTSMNLMIDMDVKNTIPVNLSFVPHALDEKNNVINDIEIDPLKVSAGNGASILEATEGEKVQFVIKSKTGDLSRLDKLAFTLDAYTDQTEGGVALKGDQGIQISNIVLEISGDIATELSGK